MGLKGGEMYDHAHTPSSLSLSRKPRKEASQTVHAASAAVNNRKNKIQSFGRINYRPKTWKRNLRKKHADYRREEII